MEIIIKGTPKEIADLALELQGRQKEKYNVASDLIQKQIELLSKSSDWAYQTGDLKTAAQLSFAFAALLSGNRFENL